MNPHARKLTFRESFAIFRRIFGLMFKSYPGFLILAIICILVSSGAGVLGNVFVGDVLIDQFILPIVADPNASTSLYGIPMDLSTLIFLMAGIYLVGVGCAYAYQILVSQIGQGTQKKLRDQVFERMEQLPLSYFDRRAFGDVMSVYTNDIDTLREMISRVLPMLVTSIVTMIASMAAMIALQEWPLILVVLAFLVIILVVVLSVTKRSSKYFIAQQRILGATNGYIEEMISGQKVIKVFNHETQTKEGFDTLNEELCKNTTKAVQFSNILGPVVNNLANIQYVVIALIGGLAIAYGFMAKPGVILSYMQLGRSFTMPISQLAMNINMLIMALAGGQRIFELMDATPEVDKGYVTLVNAEDDGSGNPVPCDHYTGKWAWKHPHTDGSGTTFKWLRGKINLYDVDFGYVPGKTVLHDITLYAEPGQKVAFVGPTGAGKTTITNLLNRFYDIEDGKIRFDDININKIQKHDLRRAMGMVLQETNLFTDTVRENIRYGNPNATDEDVVRAAQLANADNFIRMLPNGYDTVLEGAGSGLSQGQRQLISIARAACANPPVLILDEATSSIDSRTEALVQKGMDAIMKGRTVFVIAHRLSTIQNSDVIMVLEQGRIIERGTHTSLLEQKGKYHQLYTGGKVTEE
ncbi:MAG: ABC transporter ATP-binding protein/permease [Bacilli bacterium]|nr:ABC transporter ATP-binding protein/permease [Bacilli bacterium]